MLSLLSEVNAAVWEHSRVRQSYRNTLTDFAQAFQNDHNSISDAVNEIGPLLVKLSLLIAQIRNLASPSLVSHVIGLLQNAH